MFIDPLSLSLSYTMLQLSDSIEIKWKLFNYSMVQWWCWSNSFERMLKQSVKVQTSIALSYQREINTGLTVWSSSSSLLLFTLAKMLEPRTEWVNFVFIYVLRLFIWSLLNHWKRWQLDWQVLAQLGLIYSVCVLVLFVCIHCRRRHR